MTQITQAQMRKIYAMAKELNLDNDLLHSLVFSLTGMEHMSALRKMEAVNVIDELEYRKTGQRKKNTYRANRATQDQIYKIKRLEKELRWSDNPRRLKGFIRKYAKVDNLDWLTFKNASDIIEGMKKLLERERKKHN